MSIKFVFITLDLNFARQMAYDMSLFIASY